MSHYLKTTMDCIFGEDNFQNDIVWKRYAPHSLASASFDTVSDFILFYTKDFAQASFNKVYGELSEKCINKKFPYLERETGRRYQHVALEQSSNSSSARESRIIEGKEIQGTIGWRWTQETFDERTQENPYLIYWTRNGRPRYKIYADEYKGIELGNIWTDIPYLSSGDGERTGYPTQKPVKLLERIIKASSNKGDIVFDPFCGCATTCVAAEKLNRQWIGIDISIKAYELVNKRLTKEVADPNDLFKYQNIVHMRTDPPKRTDQAEDFREAKYVYIVSHPKYEGEYKVGIAKNWKLRLNSYQTSDPDRQYKIEFKYETPWFRETEQFIHEKFENKHEWVKGDLQDIIQKIKNYRPIKQHLSV